MAKTSGSKRTKKPAKKSSKRTTKKTGPLDRLLKELRQRNQVIMKEARKIDDLLAKAKPEHLKLDVLAEAEPYCPPTMGIAPDGNG